MKKITDSDTNKFKFQYTSEGRRLRKVYYRDSSGVVEADTTYYIYDGMNVVAELDENLDLKEKYIYVNGMLAGRINSDGEFYQYFHDGLGSITMISDSTGEYQNLYVYDYFGNFRMMEESGSVPNHYYYTGQERDESPSGLYNLRARYYASGIGRFTQEDPIMAVLNAERLHEFHVYTYVGNNPINYIDPLGLWTTLPPNVPLGPLSYIDGPYSPLPPLLLSDEFSKCWLNCMLGFWPMSTSALFSGGSPYAGRGVVRLFGRFFDKRLKWGSYSKVIVPKVGARFATGISVIGWAWTAYDAYKCYDKCREKNEKTPFNPVESP